MIATQFSIPLDGNITIHGEYEGNLESKKVVIMVHGFGVRRNSRGAFDPIANTLKNDFAVIKFDLVKIMPNSQDTYFLPLQTQAEMLKKVIKFAKNELKNQEINIIAHSQGCLVTGILNPDLENCILLAPPIKTPYHRLKEYFSQRKGTTFNEAGESKVKRANGSWTFITSEYWQEIKNINPVNLYQQLANQNSTHLIRAKSDEIITEDPQPLDKIGNLNYSTLPGDHNFSPPHRQAWIEEMAKILKS